MPVRSGIERDDPVAVYLITETHVMARQVTKIGNDMMTSMLQLLAVAISFCVAANAAADPRSVNDAVYSKAQAKVGEQLYKVNCLTCHDKKYFRPVLKRWDGQSLGLFFTVMAASMPESNPGSLPDKQYVDILAYILSLSRYPAGDGDLDYAGDALSEITIANRK